MLWETLSGWEGERADGTRVGRRYLFARGTRAEFLPLAFVLEYGEDRRGAGRGAGGRWMEWGGRGGKEGEGLIVRGVRMRVHIGRGVPRVCGKGRAGEESESESEDEEGYGPDRGDERASW